MNLIDTYLTIETIREVRRNSIKANLRSSSGEGRNTRIYTNCMKCNVYIIYFYPQATASSHKTKSQTIITDSYILSCPIQNVVYSTHEENDSFSEHYSINSTMVGSNCSPRQAVLVIDRILHGFYIHDLSYSLHSVSSFMSPLYRRLDARKA